MGEGCVSRLRCIPLLAYSFVAMPLVAAAGNPPLSARTLGLTESYLSYCERVDSADAARLREQQQRLVKGATSDELARIRGSDEYQGSYTAVTSFVGKVAEQNAKRTCSQALSHIR